MIAPTTRVAVAFLCFVIINVNGFNHYLLLTRKGLLSVVPLVVSTTIDSEQGLSLSPATEERPQIPLPTGVTASDYIEGEFFSLKSLS